MEYFKGLIFILIAVEIILSGTIVYKDYTDKTFCVLGGSCKEVQQSIYGEIFGIKLSIFGLICFIVLFILHTLAYNHKRFIKPYLIISSMGVVFSLYFLTIQYFIIEKICSICLVVDNIMVFIYALSIYSYASSKSGKSKL